jgi:DNA repair protein RecO
MYQKYQTDALVLGNFERGEADRVYALFTRDFGLVRARASAVRRESSKMRYGLQNYSVAHVSLVRGKRGWRVAGSRSINSASPEASALSALARISELSQKLVAGEERNEYMYDVLANAHDALQKGEAVEYVEILCVARVLYTLGYISEEVLQTSVFKDANYSTIIVQEVSDRRDAFLDAINRALTETQLIRR